MIAQHDEVRNVSGIDADLGASEPLALCLRVPQSSLYPLHDQTAPGVENTRRRHRQSKRLALPADIASDTAPGSKQ